MLPNSQGSSMKNRRITKDEINEITKKCLPFREKAFFTIMRQSGLPPRTIKQLKLGNVERILETDTPIPCKINVPDGKLPSFIGKEAVEYLKQYLRTRTKPTPESLLFTANDNPNKEINTKNVSRTFKLIAQELKKEGKITYEVKRGKPSELRLLSLKGFYRKNAGNYLKELGVNTAKGDEYFRELYREKAMPLLEIEPQKWTEIDQLKKQQQELETQNKQLTQRLTEIENILFPKKAVIKLPAEFWEAWSKEDKKKEKWLEEHTEERERLEEERPIKTYEELYTELNNEYLRCTMEELQNNIKKRSIIPKAEGESGRKKRKISNWQKN